VGDENKRRRGIARVVATVDIYPEITNKPKVCDSFRWVKKKTRNLLSTHLYLNLGSWRIWMLSTLSAGKCSLIDSDVLSA
jgi:hypothetical protein